MIKISARNQLPGTVVSIHKGAINDVVELEIKGGQRIVAVVTSDSTVNLGLVIGRAAIAVIKASSVLVGMPSSSMKLSARNQLAGIIARVTRGSVNAEVTIQLDGGGIVVAMITNASVDSLGLDEGLATMAIIKASSIILATMD